MLEVEIKIEGNKEILPITKGKIPETYSDFNIPVNDIKVYKHSNNKEADLVVMDSIKSSIEINKLNAILINYNLFNKEDKEKLVFIYNVKGIEGISDLSNTFFNLDNVNIRKDIKNYTDLLLKSTNIFDFDLLKELIDLEVLGEVVAKKDIGAITSYGYFYLNKKEWIDERI